MIFMSQHLKIVLIILIIFFMGACQDSPERHLELGNWYLQKDLVDEAELEYLDHRSSLNESVIDINEKLAKINKRNTMSCMNC